MNAHQGADGGTRSAQLSIWQWDGEEAKPLLVEVYYYAADYDGFRFDGRTLRISTKEDLRTLFSCGMCPEPRGIWTLRITPGGVKNLGHRFQQPEMQWADELLSKVNQGEDTTGLADAKVLEALKARMGQDQAEFSWGMPGSCQVLSRGQRGEFVLVVDEGQLHFKYLLRNGRPYFTDVAVK